MNQVSTRWTASTPWRLCAPETPWAGTGLAQSNFDREKNQQKVIVALREKALSAGTLANPGKVMSLISALGDNLNTNFDTKLRSVP